MFTPKTTTFSECNNEADFDLQALTRFSFGTT
jgi:hypothetical protein